MNASMRCSLTRASASSRRGPISSEDGRIATHTVAPGDSPEATGDRFSIGNGLSLTTLNGIPGSTAIQPGQVLVLDPAAVPGFVFDDPSDD